MNRPRTRKLVALGLATALFAAGCGDDDGASGAGGTALDPNNPTKIQVAISVDEPAVMNLYAAQDYGIFTKNGLEVELVTTNATNTAQILQSGSIPILDGPPTSVTAQLQGAKVSAVGRSVVSNHFIVAGPNTGVNSVADLKGKTVGLSAKGGIADMQTQRTVELAGLARTDVTLAYIGSQATIIEALKKGDVQAGYVTYAFAKEVEALGGKVIASRDNGMEANLLSYPIGVNDEYAAKNPLVIKAFLKALSEASQYVIDNRADAEKTLMTRLKFDQAAATANYDVYVNGMSADVALPVDYVERVLAFSGAADKNPAEFVTDDFLPTTAP